MGLFTGHWCETEGKGGRGNYQEVSLSSHLSDREFLISGDTAGPWNQAGERGEERGAKGESTGSELDLQLDITRWKHLAASWDGLIFVSSESDQLF